jgi:hypothetical protein
MPRSRTSQGLARPIFEVLCRKGLEKEYALFQSVSVFRGFWQCWTSVIYLEKLRDSSVWPTTLFQRLLCVSIRLRWFYPIAVC